MTFDEWWDSSKTAGTPETYAGWEQSCRQAWSAAANNERLRAVELLKTREAAARQEERVRCIAEVGALHMAQTVNNQNHPRAWHDAVDAALDAIRAG
jgi:hypothetical protein